MVEEKSQEKEIISKQFTGTFWGAEEENRMRKG